MKFEKLTENKIRIIIKKEDLKDTSLDLHTIMSKVITSQTLFLGILERAKKEVGFESIGHKLLIEAFYSNDDVIVFTITKFEALKDKNTISIDVDITSEDSSRPKSNPFGKTLKVKRKINKLPKSNFGIYKFNVFEDFCSFCNSLKKLSHISTYKLLSSSSVYLYKNTYYLVLNGINLKHKSLLQFYSCLSEFSDFCTHDNHFEAKLKEYGKCIMKSRAISTGLKYFG